MQHLKALSDIELVDMFKQTSDNNCVGVLFERYTLMVFGVCMRYLEDEEDSKDAASQVFEKILLDLKRHTIENFKSWLYSVAKNYCLMEIRKVKNINMVNGDVGEKLTGVMEFKQGLHLQSDSNEKEEKYLKLEDAMTKLNEKQKWCVELFYIQEKSYTEVAQVTGFSLNEVKSFIQNGKRNLKMMLTQNE